MTDTAKIKAHHVDDTGRVFRLVVAVDFAPSTALIDIDLDPPVLGETPQNQTVSRLLREIGTALLRIAETPSKIS